MKKLTALQKRWIERTAANNRSYKTFFYNRFFIILLSVLVQLVCFAGLILSLFYASQIAIVLQVFTFILQLGFVLYLLNKDERASTRIGWILLILLLPGLGVSFYLFNRTESPTRKMRKKLQRSKEQNGADWDEIYGTYQAQNTGERKDAISYQLAKNGGFLPYYGDEINYYASGETLFPDMLESLRGAKKYILMEYFIIAYGKMWQELLQVLLEKAEQGLKIYIVYDDFGCIMTLPPKYDRYLESLHENIHCMKFNPVLPVLTTRINNRDHRKMLVVDGEVAFTGGINIADEYIGEKARFGHWKDSGLRLHGACVAPFVKSFFDVWNAFRADKVSIKEFCPPKRKIEQADGQSTVQPYDDSPLDKMPIGETAYAELINRASKYVWIFTPYLVLDDYMRALLCSASMRGVDVRIVTPGIPDKKLVYRLTRANYGALMQAGVRIYEYTSGFIHAKSMLCDGECAIVGTINLDYRSLYHHFENAVYFTDKSAVESLKRDCEETFSLSQERVEPYPRRTLLGRLFDSVLRVFETLL